MRLSPRSILFRLVDLLLVVVTALGAGTVALLLAIRSPLVDSLLDNRTGTIILVAAIAGGVAGIVYVFLPPPCQCRGERRINEP